MMNLFDFIERFPRENNCLEYFIDVREKAGVKCKKCGCNKHRWVSATYHFECEQCKNLISIKSGTAMENSSLSIKYWFMAIHLITSTNEIFTIAEIQEKLGHAESEQVSQMLSSLNSCLAIAGNTCSFDQLLLACVNSQD